VTLRFKTLTSSRECSRRTSANITPRCTGFIGVVVLLPSRDPSLKADEIVLP